MCIPLIFTHSLLSFLLFFFFKQKTAYEMRISDWSSDVCSSDLHIGGRRQERDRRIGDEGGIARDDVDGKGRRIGEIEDPGRSEERRVGKERVSTCRSRW